MTSNLRVAINGEGPAGAWDRPFGPKRRAIRSCRADRSRSYDAGTVDVGGDARRPPRRRPARPDHQIRWSASASARRRSRASGWAIPMSATARSRRLRAEQFGDAPLRDDRPDMRPRRDDAGALRSDATIRDAHAALGHRRQGDDRPTLGAPGRRRG